MYTKTSPTTVLKLTVLPDWAPLEPLFAVFWVFSPEYYRTYSFSFCVLFFVLGVFVGFFAY